MNPQEIEKKFLLKNDDWKKEVISTTTLYQGYFEENNQKLRIRITPSLKTAVICQKTEGINNNGFMQRTEIENSIPYEDGLKKMLICENVIHKERNIVPFGDFTFEIDVFFSMFPELTTAEIEVTNEQIDQFLNTTLPQWLGEDISLDKSYGNNNLAKKSSLSGSTAVNFITSRMVRHKP